MTSSSPKKRLAPGSGAHACLPGDQDVLVGLHLGVEGAVEVVHEHGAALEVEALHEVALPEVQVDGAGMGEAEDALALHRADDLAAARLDDHELLVGRGAQADVGGGGVRPGPDQAVAAPPQASGLRQALGRQQALLAEVRLVLRRDGPLVGGRLEVPRRDVRVVQVDDRLLDAAAQEALGLAHEVLVEGVLAGDQHGPAVPGAACPAPALAQARDRAREAR